MQTHKLSYKWANFNIGKKRGAQMVQNAILDIPKENKKFDECM